MHHKCDPAISNPVKTLQNQLHTQARFQFLKILSRKIVKNAVLLVNINASPTMLESMSVMNMYMHANNS